MEWTTTALPIAGLLAGTLMGFIARRNFFCTLSALEQHWYGNNSDGLRAWVLAAVVAAACTQLLVVSGACDLSSSFYLAPSFGWLGAIIGGLAFGFGMALVGTCGFGALVRIGGGSLKSLVAILILGFTALSTQRGLLGLVRTGFLDNFDVDLSFAGSQAVPAIISAASGIDMQLPIAAVIIGCAAWWVFSEPRFRSNRTAMTAGTLIGLAVVFGWIATSWLSANSFAPRQVESASFVVPVADTIVQATLFTGLAPDYGVGLVIGTVLGSAIAANRGESVRWEACDDARELGRHIMGAVLMGFGGVLALGCTVGQGISAASLLAISVPVTMFFIGLGARMGLAFMLEGSVLAPFRSAG